MHTTKVNNLFKIREQDRMMGVKIEKLFQMFIIRLFSTDNIELRQFTCVWWKRRPNPNLENWCDATESNNRFERTHRTDCIVAIQLFWSGNRVVIKRWHLHHLGYNVSVPMSLSFPFLWMSSNVFLTLNLGVWFVNMFSLQIHNLLVPNFFRPEFKCWPRELIEKLATGKYLMVA